MSAVMSTLSMISGGRRAHRKLAHSSGRKSGQFSDAGEDRNRSQQDLNHQQRSASMQTLENSGVGINLDSLEAKMASIEVSLAGRHRSAGARDIGRDFEALKTALKDKDTLIQSLKKQLSASLTAARLGAQCPPAPRPSPEGASLSAEERRALEGRAAAVRHDLEGRRGNIQELRRRLERTHVTDNIDTRIQQAELQYKLGREELELLTLGEQARALQQLIDQAEAAARTDRASLYHAVRECGGSGQLLAAEAREGTWGAAPRAGGGMAVDWGRDCGPLRQGDRLVEVNGVSVLSCSSHEELQRVVTSAAPAHIVVLRGASQPLVSGLNQTEASSLRTELGSLRSAAEEAERAKEGLRCDNTRLTHRISYLEEQVAELLARHSPPHDDARITKSKKNVTNISIMSESKSPKSEVQVFQKGPDITAIVAKLPGMEAGDSCLPVVRPRSNASGASSRRAASPRASPAPPPVPPPTHPLPAAPHPRSLSAHSLEPGAARQRHTRSHHCVRDDYGAETDAAIRMIERNQRHMEKQRLKAERLGRCASDDRLRADSDAEQPELRHRDIERAADNIEESIKKTNWAERKTMSIIEQLKRSQRLRKLKKNESAEEIRPDSEKNFLYHRIDGKVLENAHKSSRRTSKIHSRSAKSSEFESESSDFPAAELYHSSPRIDYCSESGSRMSHYRKHEDRTRPDGETKTRPTPPRKPLRLSLHKARSAHSLVNGSESESCSRPPSEATSKHNGEEYPAKKPVKRTHASDKSARERTRDAGRATPRPARKLAGLSACDAAAAPAADDLYPEYAHAPLQPNGMLRNTGKWC